MEDSQGGSAIQRKLGVGLPHSLEVVPHVR
jgi:hypothetical protein